MRVTNKSGFGYLTGPSVPLSGPVAEATYDSVMRTINQGYQALIEQGVAPEDARGLLPTKYSMSNIVAKYNLRTFADLVVKRSDGRVPRNE